MSLLCEYIFGILVIKLGLNAHGFNLEADNQSCNQKPVIGTQARAFLCLCKWHKHVWLRVLHKAAGLFAREKKQATEQGRSFCKKNPFQLSIRKANVEAMRAVPALKTGVRAVAAH